MPRLHGDNYATGLALRAGFNNLTSRGRWALDKVTGGAIGRHAAVPFKEFSAKQLPNLREQTATALAGVAGLSSAQREAALGVIMTSADQAYEQVCAFQSRHADGLGRRSAEYTPWLTGQMIKHHAQVLGDKVKSAVTGTPAERNFRSAVNQKLWDKREVNSPFMQAAGAQVQKMVNGLVLSVGQEAAGERPARVLQKAGEPAPTLPVLLGYARQADPGNAAFMPFVASERGSTLEVQLAKDHLVAGVMEKSMAPTPEKLKQDSVALLAITTETQEKIVALISSKQNNLLEHTTLETGGPKGTRIRSDSGADHSAHLTSGLKAIVEGMSKRIEKEIGPWVGLSKDQSMQRDLQACTGIDNAWEPVFNTGTALGLATGLLGVGLKAAALTGPAGTASAALWGAATRVAGLGLSAGIQHHAGAHVNNFASGMRGWPNNAPPPMFDSAPKLLNFQTSKILQKAAGQAGFDDLKAVVETFQPLVNQRALDNEKLWGNCNAKEFQAAERVIHQVVREMPSIKALGLDANLPKALKKASLAQVNDPVLMCDLITRLALGWKEDSDTNGLDALERGLNRLTADVANHTEQSPEFLAFFDRLLEDSGESHLTPAMMTGGKAAAAQVVAGDPATLARMNRAMGQVLDGTAKDATEETIQKFIWGNMASGVVSALAMGAVGAGIGIVAGGLGAVPGAAIGVAVSTAGGVVSGKLRREQINNIEVSGFREASRRGTAAPLSNPFKAGLTTPQEVMAQVQKMGTPHTQTYTADLQSVLSRLQQNAAVKITEKAAQCGRALAACLLDNAGDKAGLKALHDFDSHSAKANFTGNKLREDQMVATKVEASRSQLNDGLRDLDEGSATKQKALSTFNDLPIVKRNAADVAKHTGQGDALVTLRDRAMYTVFKSLLLAAPKNAQGQPVLDDSTKNYLAAFIKYPDKEADPVTKAMLSVFLDDVSPAPAGAAMTHLKTNNYPETNRLSAFVGQQEKDIKELAADLGTLNADSKAIKSGDFDQVTDKASILKKFTSGYDGRTTVLTTHHVDNAYTQNRAAAFMIGSVAIGGALGAPSVAAGLAAPFMPSVAVGDASLSPNILMGAAAAATASPMSAFSGGGNLTSHTAAPSAGFSATVLNVTQSITGLHLNDLSLEGTKKRRNANYDGTLPYPNSAGEGNRLGNPFKKLGFPTSAAPTLRQDTRTPALAADAAKLVSGRAYQQVFDMARADFISHRNVGVRGLSAELMLQAKKATVLGAHSAPLPAVDSVATSRARRAALQLQPQQPNERLI
jgi:hypothetical protein